MLRSTIFNIATIVMGPLCQWWKPAQSDVCIPFCTNQWTYRCLERRLSRETVNHLLLGKTLAHISLAWAVSLTLTILSSKYLTPDILDPENSIWWCHNRSLPIIRYFTFAPWFVLWNFVHLGCPKLIYVGTLLSNVNRPHYGSPIGWIGIVFWWVRSIWHVIILCWSM
jgi:hypothetical protein